LSDHFRLYLHRKGAIEFNINNREYRGDAAHLVAHAPGIDLKAQLHPFDLLIVGFSGCAVRDALQRRFRRLPSPRDWVGALPASPCTEALRSTIGWLTDELDRPGSPLAAPGNSRSFAERTLFSLFIEALAETAPGESEQALDVGEMHVQRAEAWIEANLSEPIGVHEMASAIGVRVRSLQLTFRRLRGCSPSEAITQRRLEAVRRSLQYADGAATVTQIATDMGFYELGRFSRRYRVHFGESPSTTLARCAGNTATR
jgi:AraC-like DNA-binding protein